MSSHCSPRIAIANCEQWYIIFCIFSIFLNKLELNLNLNLNHNQQLKYFEQTELKAIAAYFKANGAQRVNHSDGNLTEISTKIVCIKDVHMDIQTVISNIVPNSVSI